MTTVDASINFLSDIESTTLQDSGPYGRIYDLQLRLGYAREHLRDLRENIAWEIARSQRPGSFSTPDVETHPDVVALRNRVKELTNEVREGQAEVGGIVFLPAVENLPEIEKRLATLNRRASKLGSEEITLTTTDERLLLHYKTSDEDTRGYEFEHVFAVLSGGAPKIPGYEFLATITPTEQGNVVKRIPAIAYGIRHNLDFGDGHVVKESDSTAAKELDSIDLTRFHQSGDICEHCHKERRRSDLYVVYNEKTGETKQVGRSCLRDYTGSNDPERIVRHLEQVLDFIRYASRSRGETPAITTEDFLTHCAAVMRAKAGYQKGLGHDAAANYYNWLYQRRERTKPHEPLWVEPTDHDAAIGRNILQWVESWDETSEFATNVKLALAGRTMNDKLYGYAGAVFVAKQKWEQRAGERQAQAERDAANVAKQHIGTVGERETFILTIKDIKWIADRYGYGPDATKPMLIMADQDGNEVKWFASDLPSVADKTENDWPIAGGTYEVKATVKYHDEHDKFGKSTVITRAKFQKTINEPEEVDD